MMLASSLCMILAAHAGAPFHALDVGADGTIYYSEPLRHEVHALRDGVDAVFARLPPSRDGRHLYSFVVDVDGTIVADGQPRWRISVAGHPRRILVLRAALRPAFAGRPAARDTDGTWFQATDESGWTRIEHVGVGLLPEVYPVHIVGLAARDGRLAVLVRDRPEVVLVEVGGSSAKLPTPHGAPPFGAGFDATGNLVVLEVAASGATCVSRRRADAWEWLSTGCTGWQITPAP
jgi:hypothetical protein